MQKIPESLQKDVEVKKFVNDAASLAWRMVTLQPPMVIDAVEQKFDEKHHEPLYGYWLPHLSGQMQYYRPTLFRSCMGELAIKGSVGNHHTQKDGKTKKTK